MKHIDWMACYLTLVVLLMAACSDKSDELGGGVLEPAEKSLVFPQKGGTRRVAVKTGGQEWNVKISETAKDWCSAQALGDAFEVTVEENNAPKSRNTRLALNSDGLTAEVEVKQMGSEPMIELGQKSITLDGDKNSFSIEVGANVPYDIVIEDDWVWHKETPDTRAGLEVVTVEFGLTRNTTGKQRDTKIIFLSEDGKIAEELKVTQKCRNYFSLQR